MHFYTLQPLNVIVEYTNNVLFGIRICDRPHKDCINNLAQAHLLSR